MSYGKGVAEKDLQTLKANKCSMIKQILILNSAGSLQVKYTVTIWRWRKTGCRLETKCSQPFANSTDMFKAESLFQ